MDAMAAIRKTFFEECEEQLSEVEVGLMAMSEGSAGDTEIVNGVFRAIHSIKGGAGAFKLTSLVAFAHTFETVLDHIRSSRLVADVEVMRVMLRASDVISDLVNLSREESRIDDQLWRPLAGELEALIGNHVPVGQGPGQPGEASDLGFEFAPSRIDFEVVPLQADEPTVSTYEIVFTPAIELYGSGNEPLVLLRELSKLGDCEVACNYSSVPALDDLEPDASYLSWTIRLRTQSAINAVREVFEFVEGLCKLDISDASEASAADSCGADPGLQAGHGPADAGSAGAITATEPAMSAPPAEPVVSNRSSAPAGSNGDNAVTAAVPTPAIDKARESGTSTAQPGGGTIRVDFGRVDRLINLVGELVISQAVLSQHVSAEGLARASSTMLALDELGQLTREIQDSVVAIRAQPVKALFQRMSRIVREVCDATGKEVRLRTEGEMTELDKTVIERLADPLTHMIRNAVDHGIETPEKRIAAGKPAEGIVRLSASHRSGRVQIEVSDDGAGIDRQRVWAKAVDRGLVTAGSELSDSEIDNLLFLPGLTTAESVSNISGRGVGMDVVKRSIQALGGRISISSHPGKGSVFVLSLPLTLAVMDGMVVSAAGQTLIVPLTSVIETLQPTRTSVHPMGGVSKVVKVRDRFVPLIDVAAGLGFRVTSGRTDEVVGVAVLVETDTGGVYALLVDAIEDQRQVVIKSVETNYGKVNGVAAATILGDGRVALILDVDDVVSELRCDARSQGSEKAAVSGYL